MKQIIDLREDLLTIIDRHGNEFNKIEKLLIAAADGIYECVIHKMPLYEPEVISRKERKDLIVIHLWNVEDKELGLSGPIKFARNESVQDLIDLYDDYRILVVSQKNLYGAIFDIKKDFIGDRKFRIVCAEGVFDNVIVSVNKDGTWAYVA